MSDDPILAAITKLGDDLRGEILKSRGETAKLIEGVHTALDGIREDLTVLGGTNDHTRTLGDIREELRSLAELVAAMQQVLLKHSTRLDDIERRIPRGD